MQTGPDTVAAIVLARTDDETTGLVFEDRRWTWREVVGAAAARASLLRSLQADGPFHVGVLLDNVPEYIFLLAGAALAGATVVGINPTRQGEELARDIRHTDCQLIVTEAGHRDDLAGLDIGVPDERVLVYDEPAYDEALRPHLDASPPEELPTPDDLLFLIFTSGSTGAPKAVRLTQGRAAEFTGRLPFGSDDVLYSAMPLFHGNALWSAVFPAFGTGASLVLRRRFSASAFLPDVRHYGCTFFNTVGRAIAHINATPPSPHDRDHKLKWALGPETSEADRAAFTARFGVPIFGGYGSSENAFVLLPTRDARPGSLGTAPEGVDVAVMNPETLQECAVARFDEDGRLLNAGEAIGELVGRNVSDRFAGYYNNPEAEAERLRGGLYWSGDLAYRDEHDVFYFAGRSGDWLRVDSENFAAAPVERILGRAPGVAGVAVYAVPDTHTGDQVMVAVEMDDGAVFDPAAFAAFLAGQRDLGPKWVPRYVRVVPALPLTATGKVDKKPLQTDGWRTEDPVWHRPPRVEEYRPLGRADADALEAELAANGRAHLIGTPAVHR
jgi:fatty-acyl-CoA synthase